MAAARFVLLTFILGALDPSSPLQSRLFQSQDFGTTGRGNKKNASLTEQPANQLRSAYRLEEKLGVYVLPRSMLCCCIFKSGRSGRSSIRKFSVGILTESKSLLAMLLS